MGRVVLVHWKASEAAERAERLRRAGHAVELFSPGGGARLRTYREAPPDAFVIDLGRLPSQGGAVATFLRQQKATRRVPIVFVDGDPEKRARVRKLLPDAAYTEWGRIRGDLRRALARPPQKPAVPGTMAGYSGTPLPKKLGIGAGSSVALLGAPAGFEGTLGALPENVRLLKQTREGAQVIVLFARSRAELERRFPRARRTLPDGGRLWIAWPKQASGLTSDLTQQAVRALGLARGLVDYKICAIDATWSALCFTRRRAG